MALTRSRWLLPALSALSAATLFIAPIARADEDKGRERGRGDDDARRVLLVTTPAQTVVVQRRDEDEDENEQVVVANAAPLVAAINNEVATLTNLNLGVEDEDEAFEVEDVRVISLANLEMGFGAQAADITNAINANAAALHAFLAGTNPNAVAISAALRAEGVDPATVLAVLLSGEEHDRLIAVTA